MFKIPLEDIKKAIKEKANISEEDVDKKIQEKLDQLSGLVSKEGAAHIIANELGVKLQEPPKGKLQIKNIISGMRDVETLGRVTQKFDLRKFKTEKREGQVASIILGDESGTIRVTMWNDQAENINKINQNDIVKVKSGYVRDNQGRLEIHLNDKSELIINPPNETVAELNLQQTARKSIKDLTENDSDVEVLGTIVQVYDPRFYEVCPQCNRKAQLSDTQFSCNTHGQITPTFSYVLNLFLDDGSENIRTVFFRDQTNSLLSKSQEEIIKFKDSPNEFNNIKNELLGKQIKISGRVSKNQMFDRLELITNKITIPNAEEELKRLEKEVS